MSWYHLFDPTVEKWLALLIFAGCFGLILYRRVPIHYLSGLPGVIFYRSADD